MNERLRAGHVCNDAVLTYENDLWQVQGDPTEGAILVAALKGGLNHNAFSRNAISR